MIRFIPFAAFVTLMVALTFPLAPVLCLIVCYRDETATTGYPSQFPGRKRAFLLKPFRLFQTFDDCLDAYWYSGRAAWMGYDQSYYDEHRWLRYVCNVLWLWRNPAYGFARLVGFEQTGMTKISSYSEASSWGKGSNSSFYVVVNARGQRAFLYEAQWFFYKRFCLEIVAGWKFPWYSDPTNKAMLATGLPQVKRYEAQPQGVI